jgi:hypothetical protein
LTSTHSPPQFLSPVPQLSRQLPPEQISFAPHGFVHLPQCELLVSVLTHCTPQRVSTPQSATQLASSQTWFVPHEVVQLPQWVGLVIGSTQLPSHSIRSGGHPDPHWPLLQTSPGSHAFVHRPQ